MTDQHDPWYPGGQRDASIWVEEFFRIYPIERARPDRETMLGWFANAIETGVMFGDRGGGGMTDQPEEPATEDLADAISRAARRARAKARRELRALIASRTPPPSDEWQDGYVAGHREARREARRETVGLDAEALRDALPGILAEIDDAGSEALDWSGSEYVDRLADAIARLAALREAPEPGWDPGTMRELTIRGLPAALREAPEPDRP